MENEIVTQENENTELATLQEQNQISTIWNDEKLLAAAWKRAKFLSETDLIPDTYKGKPSNCLIALDIANRSGQSPLTVMQNLYIVKGKPAWAGQYAIALVNASRRFIEPLQFTFVGEENTLSYGCYASTHNLKGELVKGTTITMQMAKDEGWLDKTGSKWKTMPNQMLMYRAGAFFARVNCPDVLFGLQTVEEVKDVNGYDENEKPKKTISFNNEDIE